MILVLNKMRTICFIIFLFLGITFCVANDSHKICKNNHHHHKFLYWHHLTYLAFFALKFKVILVLGSLWAITVIFGKIIAAFKIAEYMKKDNHPQVIYSAPPHGHFDKSFDSPNYFSSPPKDDFSNRIYNTDGYKTLPSDTGRGYLSTNNTPLENLQVFFTAIKRMKLTEMVFKEMKLVTPACKKKFVCEADFNVKQSVVVKTIFNLFIDDCYKNYRSKETITNVEDCTKLNPNCQDK